MLLVLSPLFFKVQLRHYNFTNKFWEKQGSLKLSAAAGGFTLPSASKLQQRNRLHALEDGIFWFTHPFLTTIM